MSTPDIHVITVQIAVDLQHDVNQRTDELIGELKALSDESEIGLRFKRYMISDPVNEEEWFEPGML